MASGLYVIVNWHVLTPGNPNDPVYAGAEFLDEASRKYRGFPNVLYEIMNEPNGELDWSTITTPTPRRWSLPSAPTIPTRHSHRLGHLEPGRRRRGRRIRVQAST